MAAKEDTVEKAFAVLEGFLDKETTSYERVCEFRENRDTQECVKLFFQIKESGDKLGVHPRIIFLQFLSMFADQGKRFFNENAGKIDNEEFGTPGMFKLFQKFQTLLDRREKPAPEESVFTADVAQEMPGWALSMQSQLDEISTAMRGEGVTRRYRVRVPRAAMRDRATGVFHYSRSSATTQSTGLMESASSAESRGIWSPMRLLVR